jgi:hypothetical protein
MEECDVIFKDLESRDIPMDVIAVRALYNFLVVLNADGGDNKYSKIGRVLRHIANMDPKSIPPRARGRVQFPGAGRVVSR